MQNIQRDREFFTRRVATMEALILDDLNALKNGEVAEDQKESYQGFVLNQILQLAITRYSAGIATSSLVDDFSLLNNLLEDSWAELRNTEISDLLLEDYVVLIWIIVVGMVQNISSETFQRVVFVWKSLNFEDWLIEYLLSSRLSNRPKVESLIFPKPYATLKSAVEAQEANNPELASSLVKRYLEKEWYKGHKEAYWYDNHKSKHDTFFGYWSFEAAAIVKIAGIEDSSFQDNEYYPKDLLG